MTMVSTRVELPFAGPNKWVALREITGATEASVAGTGTRDAIALVDLLLDVAHAPMELRVSSAAALTAPDRDRVLAAIYAGTYGPRVQSTVTCQGCRSGFDMDFLVEDLLASTAARLPEEQDAVGGPRVFIAGDRTQFRLPTGADECSVIGMDPAGALNRLTALCLVNPGTEADVHGLQEAMSAAAPILDLDLAADCPECGHRQTVRFDMQRYLLSMLMVDRRSLAFEVHTLAKAYGWGFTEIMEMPRSLRKTFVGIVTGTSGAWWK